MLSTRRAARLFRRRVLFVVLAIAGSSAWLAAGFPTGAGRALHATALAAEAPIGSFSAPAGAQMGTTSPFLLKAGVRYYIVVTGTTSQSAGADSSSEDALYCFQSSSPTACNPPFPIGGEAVGFALQAPGAPTPDARSVEGLASFGDGDGTNPAYDAGHRYSQYVTPASDTNLFVMTWPGYPPGDGVSRTGAFNIDVYGSPPPPPPIIHFSVETKAWIPFPLVVNPLQLVSLPTLTSAANPCGNVGKLPIGALTSTWYSTYFRGDTHKSYEGSYRVSSIVTFDWDGTTISNFKASGSYGTSHREVVYHLPSGDKQCTDESATATTETYGSASGSTFKLGYSSKNPLVSPEDLTPAIDSDVTGSVAADGTLTLNYQDDLFPSHGIQVLRNGKPAVTGTIGDVTCLDPSEVFGVDGAGTIAIGLTEQLNRGQDIVRPDDNGRVYAHPSKLCENPADVWNTLLTGSLLQGGIKKAEVGSDAIDVAAVRNGVAGAPLSLRSAQDAGLITAVLRTDAGLLITSDASTPIQITATGPRMVIRTREMIGGRGQAPAFYGPLSGTAVVTAGGDATVTNNNRPVAPRKPSHQPPVTRASVRLQGKRAIVHFHVTGPSGIWYTAAFAGSHRLKVRHNQVTLSQSQLAKLSFYSIDLFNNVETAHGLPVLSGATASFTGMWNTRYGTMRLTQNGDRVTGTYAACNGTARISGRLHGSVLDGTWQQTCNSRNGRIRFILSSSNGSFAGSWSSGSAVPSQPWNGTRA